MKHKNNTNIRIKIIIHPHQHITPSAIKPQGNWTNAEISNYIKIVYAVRPKSTEEWITVRDVFNAQNETTEQVSLSAIRLKLQKLSTCANGKCVVFAYDAWAD